MILDCDPLHEVETERIPSQDLQALGPLPQGRKGGPQGLKARSHRYAASESVAGRSAHAVDTGHHRFQGSRGRRPYRGHSGEDVRFKSVGVG